MNLFGPALERLLKVHRLGKQEFSATCGIHRNQLTKIVTGEANSPTQIDQVFSALKGLVPYEDLRDLAMLFLEDRRTDIGFSSADITIRHSDTDTIANGARRQLLDLYDHESDVRAAIDQIVSVLRPDTKSRFTQKKETTVALHAAESHDHGTEAIPEQSGAPARYPTTSEAKRQKKAGLK